MPQKSASVDGQNKQTTQMVNITSDCVMLVVNSDLVILTSQPMKSMVDVGHDAATIQMWSKISDEEHLNGLAWMEEVSDSGNGKLSLDLMYRGQVIWNVWQTSMTGRRRTRKERLWHVVDVVINSCTEGRSTESVDQTK